MKVLLTRPEGRNQAMVEQLTQRGIAHLVTPIIEVVSSNIVPSEASLNHADIMIFISTNAVSHAANLCKLPTHCQYYAVGQATFDALSALGIQAEQAPIDAQDSEGLLSLSSLASIEGKSVIIVRGNGGRETLAEQLKHRGAKVDYWESYVRKAIDHKKPTVAKAWIDFGIDTVVVTSGEILANLVNLLTKEQFAWLRSCHIIVPSTRVKEQALQLGLDNISNANGASTQAILAHI
ncbi:uroporphyrinogen-III synthase [Shewanella sp. WXL01]|uniref:uroporphyrinogen-III synthase n=1 Tax=Shewanella sp. WXL01 TaxID=2709721 RepID=UPI0014383BC1|nr:uroporphyrinogen-III synthase [Shewanella sp. WXL01]NKF51174.1 uroporphyrinogen-III synthase [Shewanella sp. WXL01]